MTVSTSPRTGLPAQWPPRRIAAAALAAVVFALAVGAAVWLFEGITLPAPDDTRLAVELVVVGAHALGTPRGLRGSGS